MKYKFELGTYNITDSMLSQSNGHWFKVECLVGLCAVTAEDKNADLAHSYDLTVLEIMLIHSLSCSSLITRGGAKRILSPCVGFASSPLSRRRKHISQASNSKSKHDKSANDKNTFL